MLLLVLLKTLDWSVDFRVANMYEHGKLKAVLLLSQFLLSYWFQWALKMNKVQLLGLKDAQTYI